MYGMGMVWCAQKRLFCLIITAYTALAVLGTYSGAAVEPYHAVQCEIENKTQDKIFGSLENFFIQHPAEEPAIITKLGSTRFSPCIASLVGSPISGKPYAQSFHINGTKTQYHDLRKNILLKLRI
jgi:hypothetical protein